MKFNICGKKLLENDKAICNYAKRGIFILLKKRVKISKFNELRKEGCGFCAFLATSVIKSQIGNFFTDFELCLVIFGIKNCFNKMF